MKLHLPLKLRAALLALCLTGAPSAFSFDDTIFRFEDTSGKGTTASETGDGLHTVLADNAVSGKYQNNSFVQSDAVYVDSGLIVGSAIGDYKLTRDLGKAFSFSDGSYIKLTDKYWSNGAGKLYPGSSFTIATYVNFDNVLGGNEHEQFFFGTGDGNGGGFVFGVKDGILDYLRKNVAHDKPASQSVTLTSNTWYALAVSYDSTTHLASFYIDGDLVGTATIADGFSSVDGHAAIGAGSAGGQRPFTGAMAELQILSGAKTQEQILSLFGISTVNDLWWRGTATETAWNTTDTRWVKDQTVTVADSVFVQGERVHFGTEGGRVALAEDIIVRGIETQGNWEFSLDEGKKLDMSYLTLSGTTSFSGAGTVTIQGTVSIQGNVSSSLEVAGGKLEIKCGELSNVSCISTSASVKVTGGILKLTGHDMLGWDTSQSPEKIVLEGKDSTKTATLDLNDVSSNPHTWVTSIEMNGNSVLTGTSLMTYGASVNVSGTNNVISAAEIQSRWALYLTVEDQGELLIESKIVNNPISVDSIKKYGEGKVIFSGDMSGWTQDLEVFEGTLQLDGSVTTTEEGTTLKLGTGAVSLSRDTTLEIAGTVTLKNATTGNHVGSAVAGAGKLSILEDAALTVSGTVNLGATLENAGTLAAQGNAAILAFTSKDALDPNAIDYVDAKAGTSGGNGYSSGTFVLIRGGGALPDFDTFSDITVGGVSHKTDLLSDANGNVTIEDDEAQKGLYYITTGGNFNYVAIPEDSTVTPTNASGTTATTGLVIYALKDVEDPDTQTITRVFDGTKKTTLVLSTNLNENAVKNDGIIVRSNATIQLGDSTTTGSIELNKATIEQSNIETEVDGETVVTVFTPTLTLTGKGLYKMDKATGLDADATKVGTGWSGAVQVTNTELGGNGDDKFYITALNNLGSNIEISGLSGYAYDPTTDSTGPTVTAALKLSGTALTLTDAPAENLRGGTLTLSRNLSGGGSIVNNSTGNVSLGGDISGWTGSYTASEASSVLTLIAGAELNASVTGGSVTLEGALTLGKTMSLSGSLTGAGKITLKDDALNTAKTAITVAGSVTGSGTLAFEIDSLSFLSDLADGSEFVLLSAGSIDKNYKDATVNGSGSYTEGTGIDQIRYYITKNGTSVTLSKVTLGLQWVGTKDGGWTTTTGFGQTESSPLNENSIVSFTGGGSATVDVKGNQVVKGINVDAYRAPNSPEDPDFVDTYTFTGDSITTVTLGIVHGNLVVQNNLTVNKLTSIHTGTTLTVNEGGSLTGGDMSNNGTLSIGEGSVVTVKTLTGDGAVSGDGMLVVLDGKVSEKTLSTNSGTIEMDTLNDADATLGVSGTLLVREGGSYTGEYLPGADGAPVRVGTSDKDAHLVLRASENLMVIGKSGTVDLKYTDVEGYTLGGINTKGETVLLNNVRDDVAADGTTTKVPTPVTLGSASRMEKGVLDFTVSAAAVNDSLTSADKPVVTTGAALSLKDVTLKVHEVQNKDLGITTGGQEKDIVLFVVNDTANDCEVDNVNVNMDDCPWMTKYFTNFRVVEGSVNVIGDANTGRYAAHGQTPNGTAGLALAGKAMFHLDPQTQNPDGELAQVLDMLDTHLEAGNKGAMDKLGAALAGSSLSAVGLALADDVQRQLRSIRNRTTTMGVNECVVNEDMPYVNGWISGDGNYRQLSESGTDAGYQLSSWGGTVGVDVDVNPNLTLGVAVSALFGDYTGKAADTLTGDLDTQYVSLFARVSTGSWVNTFVGTLGRADVDLERTLPGIAGKTTYKTNGMMFGFLYEVARTFALNEDASTCVQPLFNMSFTHTSLDSATEGGTADTRLTTDSASLTQFSLGLGGRLQSIVGENEYNRASIFEARALLKLDFGDRYNKLNTALAALPNATVSTRSNESGVIGAEVGASLTIPISQDAGSVFFDVNADFRADQTGVNGSVGYRINF